MRFALALMLFLLAGCGGSGASERATALPFVDTPAATTPPLIDAPVATGRPPSRTTAAPGNLSYANCDAVRAAGAAPIRVGDPGYTKKLDRDGDGIGCE